MSGGFYEPTKRGRRRVQTYSNISRRPRTRTATVRGPLAGMLVALWVLFCLAWPITVIVVALHFVLKYW